MSAALAFGFPDPVLDAQRVFRALMEALARPGTIQALDPGLAPPAPLTPELAAVALALADHDAPLWLDPALAAAPAVARYLRFHTGAAIVADPAAAAFALVAEPARLPALDAFAPGTPDHPDRSTTLVLALDALSGEGGLVLEGPGIERTARLSAAPLPEGFPALWARNRALFPRGVDLVLTAPGRVAGLPRSTVVTEG
jgi:alpha-D-ribose 1-methylphosphonate 5-triphosphate synthase subunit PhnH